MSLTTNMSSTNPNERPSELRQAIALQGPLFKRAMLFGFFTNLLVMAPTIYMLEVYDRVVNSRNSMTLAMLTVFVIAAYVMLELLEWIRSLILDKAGRGFDARINERLFDAVFEANLRRVSGVSSQMINDLRMIRAFLSSPAIMAMMDVPLALLYIIVIFMINVTMGCMSLVGAVLQVLLAYLIERDTQPPLTEASRTAIAAQAYAQGSLRNAQVIQAMGMQEGIHSRWMKLQNMFLYKQAVASDHAGAYAAISKSFQFANSSLLLGAGCWLTILGQFPGSGGLMIVASTLGGRVLAPLTQVIGMWKQVVAVRDAYHRVDRLLSHVPPKEIGMALPPPKGALSVEAVVAGAPNSQVAIIRGVSFTVAAGETIAVVGPSASGKSTLARLLVGVWATAAGKVRLDGVEIFSWNKAELGPHIGYLPQDVALFDGTLADNIARFSRPDMTMVEEAARAVGLHEAIIALPQGYDTSIGDDGCFLSGGQRQRIGLARAIYANPRFIVLDEPNSSLDEAGEAALLTALLALKAKGATVIIITHRTSVLPAVDRMLVLHEGLVKAYGPRDEVLAALRGAPVPAVPSRPVPQA